MFFCGDFLTFNTSALLVIILNSIAGFLGYLGRVNLNWELIATFTVAASLGIVAGAYLVRFVQARHLQKAFGYFLLAMAAFIFWQNRTELHSQKSPKQLPVGQVELASGRAVEPKINRRSP
ncbi:hypothetical protein B7486_50105 [cyanobacterium TDX16]|nr:hypothetical protein B7486_50105 [cyanobacterium TDX16]